MKRYIALITFIFLITASIVPTYASDIPEIFKKSAPWQTETERTFSGRDPLEIGNYWRQCSGSTVLFEVYEASELSGFMYNFDNGIYVPWDEGQHLSPLTLDYPVIYLMVTKMNIPKETLLAANDAEDNEGYKMTQEQIDILYSGDRDEIIEAFKHPTAFYYDGVLYSFEDLCELDLNTLVKMRDSSNLIEHMNKACNLIADDYESLGINFSISSSSNSLKYYREFIDALETYEYPSPQTGFATYAYAAVAVVAAAGAVAVVKRRRKAV